MVLTTRIERRYSPTMTTEEVLPEQVTTAAEIEAALRAWDWKAELAAQDRTVIWLARRTDRNYQQVYRFARGDQQPDLDWLKAAALVLSTVVAR
jgi:hypothetical protein